MSSDTPPLTSPTAGQGTFAHPLQPDVEKSPRLPSSPRRETKDDMPTAPEGADFPPLRATLTSMSAREAAVALSNFSHSPQNPQNWPNGKKWRIMLTVALTGFISTCGSSIGVPGIHAVMADFGVTNEKIGVLITTFYVLGLG